MNASLINEQAISRGQMEGIDALGPIEAAVYAISEAEVYCDIDGIDSLIHRYGLHRMSLFAQSFASIGAMEIAEALRQLAESNPQPPERLLDLTNKLITQRHGYTYEAIQAFVEQGA